MCESVQTQNTLVRNFPIILKYLFNCQVRITNRCRQKMRPSEPTTLDFVVEENNIPQSFLKADVTSVQNRHFIFATDEQLKLLSNARKWYIDGTFWIVKKPFYQLVSFHAFVKQNEDMKQVLLAFVLMSGKPQEDYKSVSC